MKQQDTVLARVAALKAMPTPKLKEQWQALFDTPPPPYNRRFLESRLAYRIQELAYGALGFHEGVAMVHCSGQIGMGEGDAAEGAAAQRFAGGWFAVEAEKEAGLRIDEGMAEAIEDDAGNVAFGIEARGGKHVGELLADAAFVVGEGSGEDLRAAELALRTSGKPGLAEIDE